MNTARILLVDDDASIVKQNKRALESVGYQVDFAYSGEEGWEIYQQHFYDVVIVDWKMDKMNGMELLEKIDTLQPNNKVIMITAYGDEGTAIEAHHHHAFDYLKKPVDREALLAAVAQAVNRKDGIISALENWVEQHPQEAEQPQRMSLSNKKTWSANEVLAEIKANTERGKQEYQKLLQLTIDLLARGKV